MRLATLLAAAALMVASFTSCNEKDPTALILEDATTSSICGYATYKYNSRTKSGILELVPTNTQVTVETVNLDKDGNEIVAKQVVKVNASGYYKANLAIPVGKSATVRLYVSMESENYSAPLDGGTAQMVLTQFYGTATATVHSGENYVCNVQATPKGVLEDAFYGDAEGK